CPSMVLGPTSRANLSPGDRNSFSGRGALAFIERSCVGSRDRGGSTRDETRVRSVAPGRRLVCLTDRWCADAACRRTREARASGGCEGVFVRGSVQSPSSPASRRAVQVAHVSASIRCGSWLQRTADLSEVRAASGRTASGPCHVFG